MSRDWTAPGRRDASSNAAIPGLQEWRPGIPQARSIPVRPRQRAGEHRLLARVSHLNIQLADDLAALDLEDGVRHETPAAGELDRDGAGGALLGRYGIVEVQLEAGLPDAGECLRRARTSRRVLRGRSPSSQESLRSTRVSRFGLTMDSVREHLCQRPRRPRGLRPPREGRSCVLRRLSWVRS